jgi:hypothetical protein
MNKAIIAIREMGKGMRKANKIPMAREIPIHNSCIEMNRLVSRSITCPINSEPRRRKMFRPTVPIKLGGFANG